jgi:aspartate racemase
MNPLGIVGGIAPESTIDYYRSIIAEYRDQTKNNGYPSVIINSIDVDRMLRLIGTNELQKVTAYLAFEMLRLEKAAANIALLAANTPHVVFDDTRRLSTIPLISIVEAACAAARSQNLKRLALVGTRYVMEGKFYSRVFSKADITLVAPDRDEQAYVHDKYMSELLRDIFLPTTREQLLMIVDRMIKRKTIQGLILAGTELPLILRDGADRPIPFLDTTKIHVNAAVSALLS